MSCAILEVTRRGALALVKVKQPHAAALSCQRDRQVHGNRRLAGSALLVRHDQNGRRVDMLPPLRVLRRFLWREARGFAIMALELERA
jgi:hypothetical protein